MREVQFTGENSTIKNCSMTYSYFKNLTTDEYAIFLYIEHFESKLDFTMKVHHLYIYNNITAVHVVK